MNCRSPLSRKQSTYLGFFRKCTTLPHLRVKLKDYTLILFDNVLVGVGGGGGMKQVYALVIQGRAILRLDYHPLFREITRQPALPFPHPFPPPHPPASFHVARPAGLKCRVKIFANVNLIYFLMEYGITKVTLF